MDILEKARAYDEALEKAKKELNSCDSFGKGTIENIFPELKEREDDKIRKEIIDYCHERLNTVYGALPNIETIKRWLAWLEKQREQKPTDNKEKLDLLNFIRKETGCGLAEVNNALLKLIKVLKQHPFPIMDKPRKLKIEWEK